MRPPVPAGLPVVVDPRTTTWDDGRALLAPTGRLLRLSAAGRRALPLLAAGRPGGAADLARRLLDTGAAHPAPRPREADDVTVVVPVKDRAPSLDRCLAALSGDVLVVDDGSDRPDLVRAVCARHGARYVHRDNGGPAAARNTAIPLLTKPFVAFVDSDCVVPEGWLQALRGHLEDSAVVAVAPRVTSHRRSPLDLGTRPALVRPGGDVGYVPTAALLVRTASLLPFDEDLRYGEDVDLVWRLVDAGGDVRYDPSVVVHHEEPPQLVGRLVRRFRYGTSAAPLSRRHPGRVAHLVASPWPSAVVLLLLGRRPRAAAVVAALAGRRIDRALHAPAVSAQVVGRACSGTAVGLSRALALAGPLAWVAALRRPPLAALLLLAPAVEWRRLAAGADPVRYGGTVLLEQAAYGAGVVHGCLRERTLDPLRPRLR